MQLVTRHSSLSSPYQSCPSHLRTSNFTQIAKIAKIIFVLFDFLEIFGIIYFQIDFRKILSEATKNNIRRIIVLNFRSFRFL